jgi:hypothetical protein
MTAFWITAYILVWPAIAAVVMALLCVSIVRDLRRARAEGTNMV